MTRKLNIIISFTLLLLFVMTFFMPALQGPLGIKLNGLTVLGAHLVTFVFIETVGEYILYLFTALTNVWVFLLIGWTFRKKVKLLPTIILGLLAQLSAWSWIFSMEDGSFLYGYWLWLIVILMVTVFAIYRALKPQVS